MQGIIIGRTLRFLRAFWPLAFSVGVQLFTVLILQKPKPMRILQFGGYLALDLVLLAVALMEYRSLGRGRGR